VLLNNREASIVGEFSLVLPFNLTFWVRGASFSVRLNPMVRQLFQQLAYPFLFHSDRSLFLLDAHGTVPRIAQALALSVNDRSGPLARMFC
jgi:hypothetical protein